MHYTLTAPIIVPDMMVNFWPTFIGLLTYLGIGGFVVCVLANIGR